MSLPWLQAALMELGDGVVEIPGVQHNARIIEYHDATTLKATSDEIAWCSSFVAWCMTRARIVGTGSARARSWLAWGQELDDPRLGCITVLQRGISQDSGHVGFWCGERGEFAYLLGGNQSNRVSVARFEKDRVLGYRWPREAAP